MSETNSSAIYRQLRQNILMWKYPENFFLVEREIAEEFGVSRAPVRDALQRLCQEGYLISYPRKGYLVNRVSGKYLMQIQQVRFQLESLSIAIAINQVTDEQLTDLRSRTEQIKYSTNPYHTANTYFHSELAKLSGNSVLEKSIYKLLGDCSLAVFQHEELISDRVNYHREIIEAIRERDMQKALMFLAKDLQLAASTSVKTLLPIEFSSEWPK